MAVIATCHDRFGRAERDDRVVRRLTARGEAEALALLRYAGQAGRHDPVFQAAGEMILQPAAWRAGLFVANELRGVICADDGTRAGRVGAMLFVDEGWRRQGIGSVLLKETMDWARRVDANTLRLFCERTDWPMPHFSEQFGARPAPAFGQTI